MKKLLSLLLIWVSALPSLHAQLSYCAGMKSHQNTHYTAQNPESIQEVLMNKYDVKFHHLNLNAERTTTFISGWVRTLALTKSALDTFAFELHANLLLDSVYSGNTKLSSTHPGNVGYARFAATIPAATLIDIIIYYHGTPPTPASGALGEGFANATDGGTGTKVTWSLSEPYSAFEWWPCKQSLQDKIDSSYVYVTTDSSSRVGSNGILKKVVAIGPKKRYEWQQTHLIDYYLISLTVSKFFDYSFYANPVNTPPILIQNYIYDNTATINSMKPIFDRTKSIMELYCKLFGPYPFANEKYGHCMAPIGGGMEHQTMTTIGIINFEIIAHELGHQWFGDAVTCATWNDIWVNEGFATYSAYLAYQYLDSTKAAPYMLNSHNSALSQPDGSVWCNDTANVSRIFSSRLTYQKGSSIIHMLRFELNNDTLFFNILKEYIRRFNGSTATAMNFKKVVEDLSGKDFTRFFNQWFFGEGYPTFNVFWNQIGTRLGIINAQSTSMPSSVSLFITPIEYKIKTTKGDTTIKVFLKNNVQGIAITIPDSVISVQVDPSNWLLCKSSSVRDPNQLPLGLNTEKAMEDQAFIYPNPATNYITVAMAIASYGNYYITDITGRLVSSGSLLGNNTEINIAHLTPGHYQVSIGEKAGKTIPFIKY